MEVAGITKSVCHRRRLITLSEWAIRSAFRRSAASLSSRQHHNLESHVHGQRSYLEGRQRLSSMVWFKSDQSCPTKR